MRHHGKSRKRLGFTLVEMLVVLAIIAGLVGVVTVNVVHHQVKARIDTARLQISQLRSAVRLYQMEQGRAPTEEQGLDALVARSTRPPIPDKFPADGYLEGRRIPRDPWGHPYIYLSPGREQAPFEIISYGSDGEPGGEADAADISSLDL